MNFVTKSMNNLLLVAVFLCLLNPKTEAQQASYFAHRCSNTTTSIINRANYQANRNSVLSWLSSNGSQPNGFYNTTSGARGADTVYGIFNCRGDVTTSSCQACVTFATADIPGRCLVETTAVIWYSECLVWYSNQNIFSVLAEEPAVNSPRSVSVSPNELDSFNQILQATLKEAAKQAANEPPGAKKYATREANFSSFDTLYTYVFCLPDLSSMDCSICLHNSIANISDCCIGREGARMFKPSCQIRFETFLFYEPTSVAAPPPDRSPVPEEEQNKSNWITILVASLTATFGLAVVSISGFFIWRRRNNQEIENSQGTARENSQEVQLLDLVDEHSTKTCSGENLGKPQEFPSIQLDILDAATNHFSNENKLGEGGFGSVYKGTLADGKEIAVKRLSTTSSQGLVEFKNEVMLIARLQHKNLVRLLGCCIEKKEKLLVYEYMPNGSLDVFLFDLNLAAQLDWHKRFNIINGIARGIMYLHEDSHLRIIHRDLKASNVLLDHNMNPKISDFGMARIFGEDKNEGSTKRIVGTYGYMAPEYAMRGHFSIKSDVFSFGVLLLEIISGKKNNSFDHEESGESLMSVAWNLWSKGEGMKLIDPLLVLSCVASEVLQCIHIGLLCVQNDPANRPTMSSVIIMLASHGTATLPHPTEPTFLVGNVVAKPTSTDGVFSINEVTISSSIPR